MDYLLDTHTLIWFITDDSKLPRDIRTLIANKKDSNFCVSIATFWEIAIKISLDRLDIKMDVKSLFDMSDNLVLHY